MSSNDEAGDRGSIKKQQKAVYNNWSGPAHRGSELGGELPGPGSVQMQGGLTKVTDVTGERKVAPKLFFHSKHSVVRKSHVFKYCLFNKLYSLEVKIIPC